MAINYNFEFRGYHKSGGLRRPCRDCEEMFFPNGKYQRVCQKCLEDIQDNISLRLKTFWENKRKKTINTL